jgi:lipid II:glycine glycyltransferase (peptidoglycan interpeptide bridge formation enzyme)
MNSFLQSKEWLDFQKSLGRKVWQIDSVSIIKHDLPLGKNYLYSPRCGGDFLSESFLKKVKQVAKEENSIFFKVEPVFTKATAGRPEQGLERFGFIKSSDIQPRRTLILDITRNEKEILNQMHQKTRYNIRLAEKKRTEIRKGDKKDIEKFWLLLKHTAEKGGFHSHLEEYYRKMLETPETELFLAVHNNKIIAANIVIFSEKMAIYLHGASDYNYRNLMAPHLLQWEQIKQAKKRGCVEYDFWGIDEIKWPGVTRFKKGFGGKEVSYIGAYDLILNSFWYKIYKIAKKIL